MTIHELLLEFLTFLLLRYLYQALAGLLEILAAPLFERFYAQFAAIFNDFYVAITNWEVLASGLVGRLIIITLELVRGKTADLAASLLLPHHVKIILSDLILLVLLDDQAQVLDLPFHLLADLASWLDLWCCFVLLFFDLRWAVFLVHQILLEWRMNIVLKAILRVREIKVLLRSLHRHPRGDRASEILRTWLIALWKALSTLIKFVGLN